MQYLCKNATSRNLSATIRKFTQSATFRNIHISVFHTSFHLRMFSSHYGACRCLEIMCGAVRDISLSGIW